ncbi:MAG: hypothetical protein SNJ56_02595, partial [Termitinemataceae bacterium]
VLSALSGVLQETLSGKDASQDQQYLASLSMRQFLQKIAKDLDGFAVSNVYVNFLLELIRLCTQILRDSRTTGLVSSYVERWYRLIHQAYSSVGTYNLQPLLGLEWLYVQMKEPLD